MKILKQFDKKPTEIEVLSWLNWLRRFCSQIDRCCCCNFEVGGKCEIIRNLREGRHIVRFAGVPASWRIPESEALNEPPSLKFLRYLVIDERGNPAVPREEE